MFNIVTFGHPSLKMKSQNVESFDGELKEFDANADYKTKPISYFFIYLKKERIYNKTY